MSEMDLHDASASDVSEASREPAVGAGTDAETSLEAPVEDTLEGRAEVRPEGQAQEVDVDRLDPEAPLADALEQELVVPGDEDDYR